MKLARNQQLGGLIILLLLAIIVFYRLTIE